jgi:hypothetical protein
MAKKTHTKHHDVSTGLYLVAMVGIVAVIGLVVLVMNSGSSATYDYDDLTGQGYAGMPGASSSSVGSGTTMEMYDRSSKSWVPVAIRQRTTGSEEPVDDGPEESMGSDCYEGCEGICMSLPEDQMSGCLDLCDDICI